MNFTNIPNISNLTNIIKRITSIILFIVLTFSIGANNISFSKNLNTNNTIPVYSVEACGNGKVGGNQASSCIRENSERFGYSDGIVNFCGKISSFSDISKLAYCVASALAYVILTFAVVRFVWGAFVLLTDTKNGKERAKSIIFNAIIAMVIAVLALQATPIITDLLTGNN